MARVFLSALAVGLLAATQVAAATALDLHADVTRQAAPQEVQLVEHDLASGESSGWHIHHGVELAYVMKGDVQLDLANQPTRLLHAGDSFQIRRDTPHRATNVGPGAAALIISYLIDKGGPVKVSVPPPAP